MPPIDIRQINAFAMQYGVVLGAWEILMLAVTFASLAYAGLSTLSLLLGVGSIILAYHLTKRFRKQIDGDSGFSVMHGFWHTLLMSIFASIWVALFVYFYLSFADSDWIFDAYKAQLSDPAFRQALIDSGLQGQLQMITGDENPAALAELLRSIPPMSYVGSLLYMNLIISPIFSLIIGISCRKTPR